MDNRSLKILNFLDEEFQQKTITVLANCRKNGYILRPFFGLRSIYDQARLWRQSRPIEQIEQGIALLGKNEAPFLAGVLHEVGPQNGRWATNALPGASWHQHGKALDCFVLDTTNNRAVWSARHPGYANYAHEASLLGLVAGYNWIRQDAVHIQLEQKQVSDRYAWKELDKMMYFLFPPDQTMFGGRATQGDIEKLKSYYGD